MSNEILSSYLIRFQKTLEILPHLAVAGAPVLRQKAEEVGVEEGRKTGERLIETLRIFRQQTGMGRGMAAPQIGESKAVFVTFEDDIFHIFINPRILETSETTNLYTELCISAGPMAAEVERPEWVVMEWQDEKGAVRKEKIEGVRARLYQHEEAHLRGKLCIDEAMSGGLQLMNFDPLQQTLRPKV